MRRGVGGGVGIPVACDLFAGDCVEESVSVLGYDHDEVVSGVRMDREADAEQAADGGPAVQDWLPGHRRRHDGGSKVAIA